MKYLALVLLSLFICFNSLANEECALTKDESRELRKEARDAVIGPYRDCKDSINEAFYWKAVAECVSAGKGENIGGGCGHMVSYGQYPTELYTDKHCDIFKRETTDIKLYFELLVKEKTTEKCST